MINAIKHKYYQYQPNEFLPIYEGGVLANKRDFHLYKLKRTAVRMAREISGAIERVQAS